MRGGGVLQLNIYIIINKNYMKKYFITSLLVIFIIPSIALASWWNPISWFNNWSFKKAVTDPQVQTIIQKTLNETNIKTQNQTEELKKQDDKIISSDKTKIEPKLSNNIIKSEQIPTIIDVCLNIEGIQTQVPNGYSSISNICTLLETKDYCPNIEGIQSEMPDGKLFYKNTNECLTLDEINIIENKVILPEEPKTTTVRADEITCSIKSHGYYLLPFKVDGNWVSGWIQVKIIDDASGKIVIKGMDLDISNVSDGFTFSQNGTIRDSYGGSRIIELKAGFSGTYKISIHSVSPRYTGTTGRVSPVYSSTSMIAEKSGSFILPNCQ